MLISFDSRREKANSPGLGWIPGGKVSTFTARPNEPGKPWLSRMRNAPGALVFSALIAMQERLSVGLRRLDQIYHLLVTFSLCTKIDWHYVLDRHLNGEHRSLERSEDEEQFCCVRLNDVPATEERLDLRELSSWVREALQNVPSWSNSSTGRSLPAANTDLNIGII